MEPSAPRSEELAQGTTATAAPPSVEKAAAQRGAAALVAPEEVGINVRPGSDDDGWPEPDPVVLSDGTRVQLYKDGEALRHAYLAIQAARFRVCLEVYIFASDETGRAFATLLGEKARQGVRVHVIYDSFGSIDSDSAMFHEMRRAGVKLMEFHPLRPWDCKFGWRPFNRDHRKLLVVDDDIAGLGGLNIGGQYAGSWVIHSSKQQACEFWRDNAIGIRGPGARGFLRSFANTWNYIVGGGRIRGAELIDRPAEAELGIMASVPTVNSPLRPMLHGLLSGARDSILLTMAYFAPDDPLVDELCRAAERGVRTRLMLPGRCDVKLVHMAARSFYEKLMSAGIEVYERQGVVLHTKALAVDERISVIGSTNLDYRSIEYNCEISAIVRNDQLGQQMTTLFENDVRFARRIELSRWRNRPWVDRIGQWAVSRARYLL